MKLRDYKKNLKTEYQDTFKQKNPKREFHLKFKLRYALLAVAGIIFAALLIQHIWIYSYNIRVEKHNESIINNVDLNHSSELSAIHTKKEYNQAVSTYKKTFVYQKKKTSILSTIFSFQITGCSGDKIVLEGSGHGAENLEGNNQYQTNIQVEGVDESDVAKCDGRYIYYTDKRKLSIYDIQEEKNVTSTVCDDKSEIFVYKNKIISIGTYYFGSTAIIYEFNQDTLTEIDRLNYQMYFSSRLIKNKLYLVCGNRINEGNIQFEKCYYDNCSNPKNIYSLYCIDLDSMETKETQLVSFEVTLYTSNQFFYFASYNRNFTSISIFSYDLEPIGVVYVNGLVLNQFSMDEYDGYFRVVSTDTTRNEEELNAITIFDLSNLERVGYLNQGIGLERQTVKSVRFDGNTCYVVTYEIKDPLYEIDCSNPAKPTIVSAYAAPGYSNYLHTFKIGDKEYVLGLGYTDILWATKISVYEKTEEGTSQIGKDFVLAEYRNDGKANYYNKLLMSEMFSNHKAIFLYNDDTYLYLGAQVAYDAYLIFKIDVSAEEVITIYKEIVFDIYTDTSRLFMFENKIYVTDSEKVIVDDFS